MTKLNDLSADFKRKFAKPEVMSLEQYFDLCREDKMAFANAAERMVAAIGEPTVVDTQGDQRLGRIFSNKKIRTYASFPGFYGAEDPIDSIAAFFRHAAMELEESRQILYLLGPVGSGKSALVERLKALAETFPIYVLHDESEKDPELKTSPVLESPLGLLDRTNPAHLELADEIGIPRSKIGIAPLSGWALQKLQEFDGDWTRFSVVRLIPSKDRQIGVMKVEPGDENNQDVSVLIGKTDLRKLEKYPQNHPYSYNYSGGLNRTNQGLMDFAEMFKANIKTLNPLLMATQEHNYNGTEAIPSMPYTGIIIAHSNESEWAQFSSNKTNEAFLDRVLIVKVPYCLRVDEEVSIYEKMLQGSALHTTPIAPGTLKMLAQWSVLTRLKEPENSTIYAKMRVYNGENVKDTMPNAKPYEEYRELGGVDEGMNGMSTRFAYKILSQVFDLRPGEFQANPIDLMYVLEESIKRQQMPEDVAARYMEFIKSFLQPKYQEFVDKELRTAYIESYSSFGQSMFERYCLFAESWMNDEQCRDPETHQLLNREILNGKLEEVEKAAGISNAKDFRGEIVNYVLRYKANHEGKAPKWDQYEKIKNVIEKRMFSATEQLMPVIAFGPKQDKDTEEKHKSFVQRMVDKGYTVGQVQVLVSWFINSRKAT